ncbi:MAG TPA: hypothetical protein VJ774_00460 [Actinomycetota bacterium]|nr:hypothetical protein [Actinomycetota bacterium]
MDPVEVLAQMLQQPAWRRRFHETPDEALGDIQNSEQIPQELLDTLRGLSLIELGAVARVTRELKDSGMAGDERMLRMPL